MTKKYIDWDKLEQAKVDGVAYEEELTNRNTLDSEISKLENELVTLKDKKKNEPEEPKSFEEFAILSAILLRGYGEPEITEARITNVTEDALVVKVKTGYSYYDYVKIVVPIKELETNQFYFDNNTCTFICDRVTNYSGFKTIIDAIFKVEKAQKVKRLDWVNKEIKKGEQEREALEKEIAQYDNIPLNKVEKMINKVSFATGWGSYDFDTKTNFIDNLPRVYKI